MSVVQESEALHHRVRAFARAALGAPPGSGPREPGPDTFDSLAVDIARYQERYVPGFRRLVEARGRSLDEASDVPAVPVEAFRLTRVAAHPTELDVARFETSGTTAAAKGVHCLRTTATYRELALGWGRRALVTVSAPRPSVVALASPPGDPPSSSLAFMMRAFMQELDGRRWSGEDAFDADAPGRWLASPDGVDVEGLRRAAGEAERAGSPLLVLATGFALVLLLDALAGRRIETPPGTAVMPTGGFKGRTRDIGAEELAVGVAAALGVERSRVVGEYGMTELSSQLYEGTLPGGALHAAPGVFLPPPWLRVAPVDPITLEPVPEGEPGLARFVDLANVDSAVAIVTLDRVERAGAGIRLLGRAPGAPARGCSLAVEEMVLGAAGPS